MKKQISVPIAPTVERLGNQYDIHRPADGTCVGNPFPIGTAGSASFRIPAIITLADGTLLAACDARWNTTYDGGGLDTITARSTDGGKVWHYDFANYLGDNGNVYNGCGSTCFIDPSLASDGRTVFLLTDLYPYGVALNGTANAYPEKSTGFDRQGRLLLKRNGENTFGYYLDGDTIRSRDGAAVSGFRVDPWFNIRGAGVSTNLFFRNAPFQVTRTAYLYLVRSTDGGRSWSAPTLLNQKQAGEHALLVSPGRGLVTKTGILVFPVYSYCGTLEKQRMGFLYSRDGGGTWARSTDGPTGHWSSESAVVELWDGTLRFFYRNGTARLHYLDFSFTTGWRSPVNTGIRINANCQLSAIAYSKPREGRQVLLVSCPTGPSRRGSTDSTGGPAAAGGCRLNGEIFIGMVQENSTMEWLAPGTLRINDHDAEFLYSCMTERQDGAIALLYEDHQNQWGAGAGCYCTMTFTVFKKIAEK